MKKLFFLSALIATSLLAKQGEFTLQLSETLDHPGDFTKFSLIANTKCYQNRQDLVNNLLTLVNLIKENLNNNLESSLVDYEIKSYGFDIEEHAAYEEEGEDPCDNTWNGSQEIGVKFYTTDDTEINNIWNNLNLIAQSYYSVQNNGAIQYIELGNPSKGLLPSTLESLIYTGEDILRQKALARFRNFMGPDYYGQYAITNISLGSANNGYRSEYNIIPQIPNSESPAIDIPGVYVNLGNLEVNVSAIITIGYEPNVILPVIP